MSNMQGKYHINPETGNANKCQAMYNCKFKYEANQHYDTKEEAKEGAEIMLHAETIEPQKYLQIFSKKFKNIELDNFWFNALESKVKSIQDKKYWTKEEKENLVIAEKAVSTLSKPNPTEEDFEKAENLINRMYGRYLYQPDLTSEKTTVEIVSLASSFKDYVKNRNVEPPKTPNREKNDRIAGLQASNSVIENF